MESQPALHLPGANDHYVEGSIFCGDFCCSFFCWLCLLLLLLLLLLLFWRLLLRFLSFDF